MATLTQLQLMGSNQVTSLSHYRLAERLSDSRLKRWSDELVKLSDERGHVTRDKRLTQWTQSVKDLPDIKPSQLVLNQATVTIGRKTDLIEDSHAALHENLQRLSPWRKGPFRFFGTHIDTEWRSDLKWARLAPYISDLNGRDVLDVGCGSGYHCWRMRGAGASLVIGIEPSLLFCTQFQATQRYIQDENVQVLPLKMDELPPSMGAFQTIFSMGVLYHRRSPFDHLANLRNSLQLGGELVLETLVVDGPLHHVLVPEDRYAQMRNVWCLPSVLTLEHWLKRMGFSNIQTVDVTLTQTAEQRRTDWIS